MRRRRTRRPAAPAARCRWTVRARWPPAAYAAALRAGHRAGLPPVRQPRGGHRAAGGRGRPRSCRAAGRAAAGGRGAVARRGGRWTGPGRCWPRARTSGAARPGSGCSRCARASGSRPKGPRTSGSRAGRAGFENIPAIVAAAASLRAVRAEAAEEAARLRALVDRIRARVPRAGARTWRWSATRCAGCPHLVTFSCLYVDGETLLHELDRAGFSVSSGSSCTSSTLTPSHVLRAMGVLSRGQCAGLAAAGHGGGGRGAVPGGAAGGGGRRYGSGWARRSPPAAVRTGGRPSSWTRSASAARSR